MRKTPILSAFLAVVVGAAFGTRPAPADVRYQITVISGTTTSLVDTIILDGGTLVGTCTLTGYGDFTGYTATLTLTAP